MNKWNRLQKYEYIFNKILQKDITQKANHEIKFSNFLVENEKEIR